MKPIRYVIGDATQPQGDGAKIIAHVCNDSGDWPSYNDKGFMLSVSKRWEKPGRAFRRWYCERSKNDFALGAVQLVPVEENLWVANMICSRGYGAVRGQHTAKPIQYNAVDRVLEILGDRSLELNASVHMPRIGCGLAGGKWKWIEPKIEKHLSTRDIAVVVYDLEKTFHPERQA